LRANLFGIRLELKTKNKLNRKAYTGRKLRGLIVSHSQKITGKVKKTINYENLMSAEINLADRIFKNTNKKKTKNKKKSSSFFYEGGGRWHAFLQSSQMTGPSHRIEGHSSVAPRRYISLNIDRILSFAVEGAERDRRLSKPQEANWVLDWEWGPVREPARL